MAHQPTTTFLGAARNVTGSRTLLHIDTSRILVDCGMYQERGLSDRNWEPFPVEPSSIDVVLLTHAHLDHSGNLPRLVGDGFQGRVYCTAATAEITQSSSKTQPASSRRTPHSSAAGTSESKGRAHIRKSPCTP